MLEVIGNNGLKEKKDFEFVVLKETVEFAIVDYYMKLNNKTLTKVEKRIWKIFMGKNGFQENFVDKEVH